jgi:hypothetical protein
MYRVLAVFPSAGAEIPSVAGNPALFRKMAIILHFG